MVFTETIRQLKLHLTRPACELRPKRYENEKKLHQSGFDPMKLDQKSDFQNFYILIELIK